MHKPRPTHRDSYVAGPWSIFFLYVAVVAVVLLLVAAYSH